MPRLEAHSEQIKRKESDRKKRNRVVLSRKRVNPVTGKAYSVKRKKPIVRRSAYLLGGIAGIVDGIKAIKEASHKS